MYLEKIKKYTPLFWLTLILSLNIYFLLHAIEHAYAQFLPLPTEGYEGFAKIDSANGNYTFVFFLQQRLIPIAKYVIEAFAIAYMTYYGASLIFSWGKDDIIKKDISALSYSIIAFLFLNIGEFFVDIFNPDKNAGEPDIFGWGLLMGVLIDGIRIIAGTIAVVWLIISGMKLITASGNDAAINAARKQIVWSLMGLVIIALAGKLKDIVFYAETKEGISLFSSITNLLLLFTVPLGFLFMIIGAFYMIASAGNDARVTKGKKIIQATIIALVVIYSAYTFLVEILKFSNY